MLSSSEIRSRFLEFFKKHGHTIIPSASLVPENDPSVLFNTAGMQPLVPYLLGEPHPGGTRLADSQKCVRTVDIDEIGDNTHATFFEMLGNWSLGDYFKKETISWSYEFLTSKDEGLGLDPSRLYVTVFGGNVDAPKDEESYAIWKSLFEKAGVKGERIYFMTTDAKGKEPNWWSAGDSGPCGPDTEMFYDVTGKLTKGLTKEEYMATDDRQDVVEIWNDVFMEYLKKDGTVVGKLSKQNVDTGSGLERIAMVVQGKNNIFETDIFSPIMDVIKSRATHYDKRAARIIADHIRTSIFLIADGVVPANTDQGYILRRLLRRSIMESRHLGAGESIFSEIVAAYVTVYGSAYPNLQQNQKQIKETLDKESEQFGKTLAGAIKKLWVSFYDTSKGESEKMNADVLFRYFTTEGFPSDLTLDQYRRYRIEKNLPALNSQDLESLMKEFKKKMDEHQEISRAGSEQKFKGGLADHSEMSVQYHTATHLLHQALRTVLGPTALQKGSNITPERLRFDFAHTTKMTDEEKKKVEDLVNAKIAEALPVSYKDIPMSEAEKLGAIGLFEEKYGDKVRVYQIGVGGKQFSLEFCGGPHVKNTSELGHFRIAKEEAVSQGIRRIKAVLE